MFFVAIEILCHDKARSWDSRGACDRAPLARDRVRDRVTTSTTACSVRTAVHTKNLRQCTVLCTVWITVHRHCSRTLFMGTVQKKKSTKVTPGNWGATKTFFFFFFAMGIKFHSCLQQ